MKEHWVEIHKLCKEIFKFYEAAPEYIVKTLNAELDKGDLHACKTMIASLAKKSQLKLLLGSEDNVPHIDGLAEAFIKIS